MKVLRSRDCRADPCVHEEPIASRTRQENSISFKFGSEKKQSNLDGGENSLSEEPELAFDTCEDMCGSEREVVTLSSFPAASSSRMKASKPGCSFVRLHFAQVNYKDYKDYSTLAEWPLNPFHLFQNSVYRDIAEYELFKLKAHEMTDNSVELKRDLPEWISEFCHLMELWIKIEVKVLFPWAFHSEVLNRVRKEASVVVQSLSSVEKKLFSVQQSMEFFLNEQNDELFGRMIVIMDELVEGIKVHFHNETTLLPVLIRMSQSQEKSSRVERKAVQMVVDSNKVSAMIVFRWVREVREINFDRWLRVRLGLGPLSKLMYRKCKAAYLKSAHGKMGNDSEQWRL